jgi:phage head maturation protease
LDGLALSGATKIVGYAQGAMQGRVMRAQFLNGDFDEVLEHEGVDLEALYQHQKAELIKEALADQLSATRRAGTAKGDVKFTRAIDK